MTRDPDLTEALQRNLDAAFPILVRAYQSDVYSLIVRSGADPAAADDIAAETFLRAYRALRGYADEQIAALRPGPWLVTIALNTWRNEIRSRARRRESSLESVVEPAAHEAGPEAAAVAGDDREQLTAALEGLPEGQRLAVVLRHIVGLPYREVAEALGKPEGTVKSDVSRGLAGLRRRLPRTEVVA